MTNTERAGRIVIGRSAGALLAALGAGIIALASPPAALLVLALLAARVLMRGEGAPRIKLATLLGPAFAALIAGALIDLSAAIGMIFIWRLFADARWSVREAGQLANIAGRPGEARPIALAHAWLTPLYGLAIVAFTAPHMVAGLPLDLPHVPSWVPITIGVVAGGFVFDWALRRAADWRLGELAPAPTAHLLAHHALFVLAYGLTLDVSAGLVALVAWRLAHAAPFVLTRPAPQASFTAVP